MIVDALRDPESGLGATLVVMRPEGLCFGGTRFSASSSTEEVVELARCMEVKLHPHTLVVGGAKAGFFCDPDHPELPRLMALAAERWSAILRERVMLGKDMGASNALMDGFYEHVGAIQLAPIRASTPLARLRELSGYRVHMTGLGVAWAVSAYVGHSLAGLRVAIQGAGAVGLGTAIRLTRMGAVVVGLSDVHRAVHFRAPPDEARLVSLVSEGFGMPAAGDGLEWISRESLFELPVDVVVLAASSNSVGSAVAEKLSASFVVEGSNFGLQNKARVVLQARSVPVIPDVIASSASAAMVARQLASGGGLSDEALWFEIERCIREQVVLRRAESLERGISMRTAAFQSVGLLEA